MSLFDPRQAETLRPTSIASLQTVKNVIRSSVDPLHSTWGITDSEPSDVESSNELVSLQYEGQCLDIAYWRCRSGSDTCGIQYANSCEHPLSTNHVRENDGLCTDTSAIMANMKDHIDQAAGLIPLMMVRTTV